jgi:hypothetical protein
VVAWPIASFFLREPTGNQISSPNWIGGVRDGEEGGAVVEERAMAVRGGGGGASTAPGGGLAPASHNQVSVWVVGRGGGGEEL